VKNTPAFLFSLVLLNFALPAEAGSFASYQGSCSRVKASPKMQRCIEEISRISGRKLSISSCQRSRSAQVGLWRKYNGDRNRVGHPDTDQHVVGIAADFRPFADRVKQCKILDQVRSSCAGGAGGVGSYRNSGSAHFDIRASRAQWNVCRNVLGSGSGLFGFDWDAIFGARLDDYRTRKRGESAQRGNPSRKVSRSGRSAPSRENHDSDDRWANLFKNGNFQ